MIKTIILLLFISILSNCSFEKRVDHHGVHQLKKKVKRLLLRKQIKMILLIF